MSKKTLSVNIISSCVCRDCFEIGNKKTKHNNYKVEFFYQATNVFSLYSKKLTELQDITENDLVFGSPWQRRIFLADIKKDIFERIGEEKRDNFLILEFTDFAKNLYKLKSNEDSYLVQTEPSKNNQVVFSDYVEKIVEPWKLPKDYVYFCLEKYVEDILKIYSSDKIILCEIYHTDRYITLDNRIEKFKAPVGAYNKFLKECYLHIENEFIKRQAQIHIVKMPENALGDEGQKWGKYSLHFVKELYEYLFSAIDAICTEYDKDEEAEILSCLKEQYEKRTSEELNNIEASLSLNKRIAECLEKQRIADEKIIELENQNKIITREKETILFEKNSLQKELSNIKASKAYKIGRAVTFVPRKLFKRRGSK